MSFTIGQNSVNTIRPTLSESVTYTGSPVYFLFRFYNLTTHVEKLFTATDLSTNIARYNEFNIRLSGSSFENFTASTPTINISTDTEIFYEVYEMLNPTNLFISGTSCNILEKGIIRVTGSTYPIIAKSYTGQSTTYKGYSGQR